MRTRRRSRDENSHAMGLFVNKNSEGNLKKTRTFNRGHITSPNEIKTGHALVSQVMQRSRKQ